MKGITKYCLSIKYERLKNYKKSIKKISIASQAIDSIPPVGRDSPAFMIN